MVKTKNKVFSIALCLILCLAMVLGGIKIASGGNGVSATTHYYTEATLSGAKNSRDEDGENLWWLEILNSDERFVQEKYKSITITNTSEPTEAVNEPFDVSEEKDGRLNAYYIKNGDLYDCIIYGDCEKIYAPVDSGFLFGDNGGFCKKFSNLQSINFECFDTSRTEIMYAMFMQSGALSTIKGLENFDTSNVTYMNCMFLDCNSLTTLDLSSFDTSNVTYLDSIFYGCRYSMKILASPENESALCDIVDACGLDSDVVVKVKPTIEFASAGDTFKFNFGNLSYEDLEGAQVTTFGEDWDQKYDTVTFDGKTYTNCGIFIEDNDGMYIHMYANGVEILQAEYHSAGGVSVRPGEEGFDGWGWDDLEAYNYKYPAELVSEMTYTFENDFYVNPQGKALLNKLLTKVVDDVEDTGIDLYSGLAISGAMLLITCACAVIMSKMKRKQSI